MADLIAPAVAAYSPAARFFVSASPVRGPGSSTCELNDFDLTQDEIEAAEVPDAVISCLEADPLRYGLFRGSRQPNSRRPPRAVLVQRSAPADLLGVAFTANPVTAAAEIVLQVRYWQRDGEAFAWFTIGRDGNVKRLQGKAADAGISQERLVALGALCRRAETALTWPCEINWAIDGQNIRIVGAQPMHAPSKANLEDSWTRANIGEVVPECMTPLSYSAWSRPMELLFRASFRHFKVPWQRFRFIKNEGGKLWYNIGAINYLTGLLGLPGIDLAIGSAPTESDRRLPSRLWPGRIVRHAFGLARASAVHAQLARRVAKESRRLQSIAKKFRDGAASASSPASCLDLASQCYAEVEPILPAYADATSASFSALALLDLAASRWLPASFSLVPLLTSNGVLIAGAAEALRELRQDPEGREMAEQFMERFGHRGWQEVEFMSPTWRELGDTLWRTQAGSEPGAGTHQRKKNVELPTPLSGLRRAIFAGLVERANLLSVLRENIKHEFFRPIDAIRQLLRKAGGMLAEEGRLAVDRDLYFLSLEEVELLVSGRRVPELRSRAAALRALWERKDAQSGDIASEGASSEAKRRQGFGASRGRVSGPARVLRSPHEIARVRPGDILVAEVLDAGWFPLFSVVGGLVTSLGGVLSHPCIVAREFGIPAVVGIDGITECIQDGCWLVVDGERGTVETMAAWESSISGVRR